MYVLKDDNSLTKGSLDCMAVKIQDTKAYYDFCIEKDCSECLCSVFLAEKCFGETMISGTFLILHKEKQS